MMNRACLHDPYGVSMNYERCGICTVGVCSRNDVVIVQGSRKDKDYLYNYSTSSSIVTQRSGMGPHRGGTESFSYQSKLYGGLANVGRINNNDTESIMGSRLTTIGLMMVLDLYL